MVLGRAGIMFANARAAVATKGQAVKGLSGP